MSTLKDDLSKLNSLLRGDHGHALWDIITCSRGPDSPSERPSQPQAIQARQYAGRRERKRRTGEVIRGAAFPGIGGARYRTDIQYVTLPPEPDWDHYDKHVARAAKWLNLEVRKDPKLAVKRVVKNPKPLKPTISEAAKVKAQAPLGKTHIFTYDSETPDSGCSKPPSAKYFTTPPAYFDPYWHTTVDPIVVSNICEGLKDMFGSGMSVTSMFADEYTAWAKALFESSPLTIKDQVALLCNTMQKHFYGVFVMLTPKFKCYFYMKYLQHKFGVPYPEAYKLAMATYKKGD